MKNNSLYLKLNLLKLWFKKRDPLFELFIKGKKTLDVGCGEGKLLAKDKQYIYGIDINQTLVSKLFEEGYKIKYGDVTDIPFEPEQFEVVVCSNVIEHLDPLEAYKMFLEIKRVLIPGGVLLLTTPMPCSIWNTFGHVKPYPPNAIEKLFRPVSREEFDSITTFEIQGWYHLGAWAQNRILFFISTIISWCTPWLRHSYVMIIKKK
jgi:SAM-dependent methyltransferase